MPCPQDSGSIGCGRARFLNGPPGTFSKYFHKNTPMKAVGYVINDWQLSGLFTGGSGKIPRLM